MSTRQRILEIVLVLMVGLLPLLWYRPGFMALGHDMGYPLAPIDHFVDRLYTWTDRLSPFGSDQTESLSGWSIHGLEWATSKLGLSLVNSQQVTFMFWAVLPAITMYILLRHLYPDPKYYPLRLVGSWFLSVNYYMLQGWSIAERTKFSIMAMLPMLVLSLIKIFRENKSVLHESARLSLLLFVFNGGSGIPLWGGLALTGLAATIALWRESVLSIWEKCKKLVSFTLLLVTFLLVTNLYWVMPYVESYRQNFTQRIRDAGGIERVIEWSTVISSNASWLNLFKMQGLADWYQNPEHPYTNVLFSNPPLVAIAVLLPVIAFLGLLNRSWQTNLFLTLLLVGIPFAAGSHPPLGKVYDWLLTTVPGFSMFRTPIYKFGMVVWFAFAYLIANGVQWLSDRLKIWRWITSTTVMAIIFIYHYPVFTGVFFCLSEKVSTMVQVPGHVLSAKKELDNNLYSTRVLLLPPLNPGNSYEMYNWRYFSLSTIPSLLSRRSVIVNNNYVQGLERNWLDKLYADLLVNGKSDLVSWLGIDKVIIRHDFSAPAEGSYVPDLINSSVIKSDQFEKQQAIGDWEIFSANTKPRPLFSLGNLVTKVDTSKADLGVALDLTQLLSLPLSTSDILPEGTDYCYVQQAKCTNCPSKPKDYSIALELPDIFPGTMAYRFGRLLFWPSNINDLLKRMMRDAAALHLVILNTSPYKIEDTKLVKYLLSNWQSDWKKVFRLYQAIDDAELKEEKLERIVDYYKFFVSDNPKWVNQAKLEETRRSLSEFLIFLNQYRDKFSFSAKPELSETNQYQYQIDINNLDKYFIYVGPISEKSQDLFSTITVGNKLHRLSPSIQIPNWLVSSPIELSATRYIVKLNPKIESDPKIFVVKQNNSNSEKIEGLSFQMLNQTQYLLKVPILVKPTILSFNSRYDNGWQVKDVSNFRGSFIGQPKLYDGWGVTEFPRQDKLFNLQYFKSKIQTSAFHFTADSYANAWVLAENKTPQYLLIEYRPQQTFYKFLLVSAIGVSVIGLIFLKTRHA